MAPLHGSRGRIYMAIASGGTAEPLAGFNSWSIDFSVDNAEVTAFGDLNKQYVAGLPDASGEFSGVYDDATAQTYTAATDGVARKFYLYPVASVNTKYWFGTILPDFSVNGAIDGPVEVSASWAAASSIIKVG